MWHYEYYRNENETISIQKLVVIYKLQHVSLNKYIMFFNVNLQHVLDYSSPNDVEHYLKHNLTKV